MLNWYHGRTAPVLLVLSAPPFAGGRLSGGRWTFGLTRNVTAAPGCRE
jgi:hypothetical protein